MERITCLQTINILRTIPESDHSKSVKFRRRQRHWFTIWRASPILPREASRRREASGEFGLSRLVSENSGFAHVHHIITTNHIYLVNIDKLLYEILSLRCQLVMKFWRNRRCPTKSSFKSYFGECRGHVETSQSRTMFYTPLKTCCPRENGSARRGAGCTSR